DVTRLAGLDRKGWWIGCGSADYDQDGRPDLFVTGYNVCALYHNEGNGRFREVSGPAGIPDRAFQTSCAFGDLDGDGFPDLYICHYLRFGPGEPQYCQHADTKLLRACGP